MGGSSWERREERIFANCQDTACRSRAVFAIGYVFARHQAGARSSTTGSIRAPNEPELVIGGATWSPAVLNHLQPTLLMLLSLVLSATLASAQPTEVVREQITLRGTVEAVDQTARTVRIRGDRGNVVTLDIPQSVVPFDQLQVGDVVSVAYYDRVSVRPKPAGEPAVDRTDPPVTTPTPRRSARRHGRVAARDDGHHHGLGPCTARGDVHGTNGCRLLAPSAGYDRRQHHGGAQGRRSRGRDADRSGSPRGRIAHDGAGDATSDFRNRVHALGPLGMGQPVQRQHDSGGQRDERPLACRST